MSTSITIDNPNRLPWVTKRFTMDGTLDTLTEVRIPGDLGMRQVAIQSITNAGTVTHWAAGLVLDRTAGTGDDYFNFAAASPIVLDLADGRSETQDDYVFFLTSATGSTEFQLIVSTISAS